MNDSQIAAIVEAVIEGDLGRARAAAKRAKTASVRPLAAVVAADDGALTALEGRHPSPLSGPPKKPRALTAITSAPPTLETRRQRGRRAFALGGHVRHGISHQCGDVHRG
jgi:hypothetical protein